jgi:hypothetical protein
LNRKVIAIAVVVLVALALGIPLRGVLASSPVGTRVSAVVSSVECAFERATAATGTIASDTVDSECSEQNGVGVESGASQEAPEADETPTPK